MALQKRFNDPRKQFVDPYWTIISGVLSHGRGRSEMTLDRLECVEFGVPSEHLPEADFWTASTDFFLRTSMVSESLGPSH